MRLAAAPVVARAGRAGAAALLVLWAATACGGGDKLAVDDSSPEGAVTAFVAAEAAGAHDVSWGLLRDADREELRDVADWRDAHATTWPVAGGDVTGLHPDGDRATVDVDMHFRATLEPARGLVPARGRAHWVAVRENEHWRIAYQEVRIEPQYPDDGPAVGKVQAWAEAHQACQPAPEYQDGLVGFPALADGLCRREGAVAAGGPAKLDPADADPVVSAFGRDALDWARVVPLTSPPGLLRAVVAPVGDDWTVIGVLDPGPTA